MSQPVIMTLFDDVHGYACREESHDIEGWHRLIVGAKAPSKDLLPLLCGARFGTKRSAANSLRHGKNVRDYHALVADYDLEKMPFVEAVKRLRDAELSFIAYTTPSHTAATPRWRVIVFFSTAIPASQLAKFAGWLNGVLGGVLASETQSIGSAFYYGQIDGAVFETAFEAEGEPLDECDELAAGAIPLRSKGGNGDSLKKLDDLELERLIREAENLGGASWELAVRWARLGIKAEDAEKNLLALFDQVDAAKQDGRWQKRRALVGRWVARAYARLAKKLHGPFGAALHFVEEEPHWVGAIRLNAFSQTIEVCEPFPAAEGQVNGTSYRPLRENKDVLEMMLAMQACGFDIGKLAAFDLIVLAAERHPFHPVRQFLDSLEGAWDGEERAGQLLLDYFPCGREPDPELSGEENRPAVDAMTSYLEHVGRNFIVGAVARIFEPGCKLDTAPLVIGPQGWGKSQGVEALCPRREWYSDDLSADLADRDTKQSIVGIWLCEIPEITHHKRGVNLFKAFMSRRFDRFRAPYGRGPQDYPRTCAFFSTSNRTEFYDDTGNRRIYPAHLLKPVDVEAIKRDILMLWAEAVALYRAGHKWWLASNIEAIAQAEQAEHFEGDTWDDDFLEWVEGHERVRAQRGNTTPFLFSLSGALIGAIGLYAAKDEVPLGHRHYTKTDEMRLAHRLRILGFEQVPYRSRATGRAKLWRRNNT